MALKLWQRYYFKELLTTLILFITVFYLLFAMIDFTVNAKMFGAAFLWPRYIAYYYFLQFFNRATLLIPFGVMIATIKVLTTANQRRELVALLAGGIPIKTILTPFLLMGAVCTVALYGNAQFTYPWANQRLAAIQTKYFHGHLPLEKRTLNVVRLENSGKLFYQFYDKEQGAFFDAYWLKKPGEIYRMKYLDPHGKQVTGRYVDKLMRLKNGEVMQVASYENYTFNEMRFDKKALSAAIVIPELLPISELCKILPRKTGRMTDREAQVVTTLYHKLSCPLICVLVVVALAPFCLKFSRHQPLFLTYCLSIAGFLIFWMAVDSSVILGENHVASPFVIIWTPIALAFTLFGYRLARLS